MNRKQFHTMQRLKTVSKYANGAILDLGCKDNPNPYIKDCVGIDLYDLKLPKNYKRFIKHDLNTGLPNNLEKFNTIIACEVLEHLENTGIFLKSCFNHLEKHGKLIITIPNIYCFKNHAELKEHINLIDSKSLKNHLLKQGFECVKIKNLHRFFIELPSWWMLIIAYKTKPKGSFFTAL